MIYSSILTDDAFSVLMQPKLNIIFFVYQVQKTSKVSTASKVAEIISRLLFLYTLLQNTFVVSAGKVSLVSVLQADTIYMIRKRRSF
jgi:hypothetical protein